MEPRYLTNLDRARDDFWLLDSASENQRLAILLLDALGELEGRFDATDGRVRAPRRPRGPSVFMRKRAWPGAQARVGEGCRRGSWGRA